MRNANPIVRLLDTPAVRAVPDLCPGLHGQLLWVFVGQGEVVVLIGSTAWRLPVMSVKIAHGRLGGASEGGVPEERRLTMQRGIGCLTLPTC